MLECSQAQASPTGAAAVQDTAVHITAVRGRTILRLKSWESGGGKLVVLAGQVLPSQVGATLSEPLHVLCLGPGDWMIVSSEQPAARLRERLEPDLAGYGLAVVDLTDGFASLDIRGAAAREVLSKGCGLDLHQRRFRAGQCAHTLFAQVPVIIECLDGPLRFELTVARTYFGYLRVWLADAAAEFCTPAM